MIAIENYAAKCEQLLNPIDWVPVVCTHSGVVRVLAGLVEIAALPIFLYARCTHLLLTTEKGNFFLALSEGFNYLLHAITNIFRGILAINQATVLFLLYDNMFGRFHYTHENIRLPHQRNLLTNILAR